MKTFREHLAEEPHRPVVLAYGRMNPGPTAGHGRLIDHVMDLAAKTGAHHEVILSHTRDGKNNPLSVDQKIGFARRMYPNTNFVAASPEEPSLSHHLHRLHGQGYTHATIVAGSDRIPDLEFARKYNGKGGYDFKHIGFSSCGDRDPDSHDVDGVSSTKMRDMVKRGDYEGFRAGLPPHADEELARDIYHTTRSGLNPYK